MRIQWYRLVWSNLNNDSNLNPGGLIEDISSALNSFDFASIIEGAGQLADDTPNHLTQPV